MGRGSRSSEAHSTFGARAGTGLEGERFQLKPPTGRDTASEAQRLRLESEMNVYTNSVLNRQVSVTLTAPDGAEGSYTDMAGNITVFTGWPPEVTPELLDRLGLPADTKSEDVLPGLRELTTQGLLRHEWAHEWKTDPETFRAFSSDLQKLDRATAGQLHGIWNSLEDGMIEEQMRSRHPGAFEYISALNRIHPRVGQDYTLEEDKQVPFDGDYTPRDANGKKLKVVDTPLGKMIVIPKGTTVSPWGQAPLSTKDQMRAAILAESVPEFAPGELHPLVQETLDEVRPFIDAAVRGNTADCVANAYKIHKLLLDKGLLLSPEEMQKQAASSPSRSRRGSRTARSRSAPRRTA